jgi:uncharacterized membrane protein
MKKIFRFDLAWVILFLVASTLITLNFMEEETARNLVAGVVLFACAVIFLIALVARSLTDRIG